MESTLTVADFVKAYYPFAKESEQVFGIPALVTLGQAAFESGWGEKTSGKNNFFGIKDFDGINGNEELVQTTEYNKNPNLTAQQIGLQKIVSVMPSSSMRGYYRYLGYAYFRKFDTPKDAFDDHAKIFHRVGSYKDALAHVNDPETFARMIAPYYAQDPKYADTLVSIMRTIKKQVDLLF